MYQILIEAEEFRGKRTVQQHRLVNEVGTLTLQELCCREITRALLLSLHYNVTEKYEVKTKMTVSLNIFS